MPRNVAEAVDPPKVDKKVVTPLSAAQTRIFLEAARGDRLESFYVLATYTGLRQGELLALRWDDVNLDAGVLQVRGTKTARSRRTVKLSLTAVEALRSHLTRQLEEIDRAGDMWRENGLVFATEIGTPINRQNLTQRSFKPLLQGAGLPEIRFHDLRHTCRSTRKRLSEHSSFVAIHPEAADEYRSGRLPLVRLPAMPTVLREGPYRFFFYSNEGTEPPHVHVEAEGSVAKFCLHPVGLARNHGFAPHCVTQVQSIVEQHNTDLLRAWDDHFGVR